MLSFSPKPFLAVFFAYNEAVWPVHMPARQVAPVGGRQDRIVMTLEPSVRRHALIGCLAWTSGIGGGLILLVLSTTGLDLTIWRTQKAEPVNWLMFVFVLSGSGSVRLSKGHSPLVDA